LRGRGAWDLQIIRNRRSVEDRRCASGEVGRKRL